VTSCVGYQRTCMMQWTVVLHSERFVRGRLCPGFFYLISGIPCKQIRAIARLTLYCPIATVGAQKISFLDWTETTREATVPLCYVIVNESVPKITINGTINLFFKLQSAFWQFQNMTVSECCLIKLLPYILFEKYIFIY